jgi:putative flippase GtrA
MNTILRYVVSILAGILAFAVVGIGVTEALAPSIWLSALIGIPAGVLAGLCAIPLTYLGLSYWSERRKTGEVSATTRRRFWTLLGAIGGFVLGGGLAMAILSTQGSGLASAIILAGFPVGLLSAVLVGYLTFRRSSVDRRPPGSTAQ